MTDILIDRILEKNNPTVVGLDPQLSFIPQNIKEQAFGEHGKTLEGAAACFFAFNKLIIDAVADLVPAVKPQIAMYEQFGAAGIDCYIKTINYAKKYGLIVIGDIKRSDIASTAEAYANGHIGEVDIEGERIVVYNEDFITLNPYLGADTLEPFIKNCTLYNKGIFVLVKTSNAGSGDIQDLITDSATVYETVGNMLYKLGENTVGSHGFSKICAVVGATYPNEAKKLREQLPNTFFLVPGYGAQGAKADALKPYFTNGIIGAVINSSRGIIAQKDDKNFTKSVRQACIDMKNDLLNSCCQQ